MHAQAVRIFWPVMTECPFQGTFSSLCDNVSVDRLKIYGMVSSDSLMIRFAISLKKTGFHDAFMKKQKFQNKKMTYKESSILKNPLFRLAIT
jgi:hypothetical protein